MRATSSARGLMRGLLVDPRPYPEPFSITERALIEEALVSGVAAVKANKKLDLHTCDEVDLNIALENELNRMLNNPTKRNPGFSKALFETVVRGPELPNHDGTMPEKRPDLAFRSTRALPSLAFPAQCVLLVECKIVDAKRTMSFYCGKGLLRFVDGTYAWAVRSAYMIGYARGAKYKPMSQLAAHLGKYGTSRYSLVGSLAQRTGPNPNALCVSVHDRPNVPSLPRGPARHVTVTHMWFAIT